MNLKKLSIRIAILVLFIFSMMWLIKKQNITETEDVAEVQKPAKYQSSPDITVEDLKYYICVLASDSLEGRESGTSGEIKAGNFIRDKFSDYGLRCHIQPFRFLNRMNKYDYSLSFGQFQLERNRDFYPLLSMDGNVFAEVVFVGYGYNYAKNGKVANDYKDVDVSGKWVMIFEGSLFDKVLPKANQSIFERYDIAQRNGATGIFTIALDSASNGQLVPGGFGYSSGKYTIPMIRISGKTADSLFQYTGSNTSEALKNSRKNIQIPVKVNCSIQLKDSLISNNIIAYLEGSDSILKKEYIIVGAHYDHLGIGTSPTIDGYNSSIYYGADDNASGTAGVMELAEKLVASGNLKRSLMFVLFGAEEQQTLWGSYYFCDNFPVPRDDIKLMINMDMIGRMDSAKNVYIFTDAANNRLLNNVADSYPDMGLNFVNHAKGDYFPFYLKKIPTVNITTGTHKEYHTPKDKADLINYEGEKQLLDLIYDFIILKANAEK